VFRRWIWLIGPVLVLLAALGHWRYRHWREHRFDAAILTAAQRYGVEPALVKAVVWRESGFNWRARGRSAGVGLMQVGAAAAKEWAQAEKVVTPASEQLLDPATNTLAGTWYLGKLLRRYQKTDGPIAYALADYNAGRSNVLRWFKGDAATNSASFVRQMDFPGTRKYVLSVMQRYRHYRPVFRAKAQNAASGQSGSQE
jgi:soluble lytic murein transglycosylase